MLFERRVADAEEEIPSLISGLTDVVVTPRVFLHPLARRLGKLLTDPRISEDFFQTVYAVQAAVNQESPPKQIMNDARYLLLWFRQSVEPPVAEFRPVPELEPPSVAAAVLTYNIASQYGVPEDAAAIAAVLHPKQLLQ